MKKRIGLVIVLGCAVIACGNLAAQLRTHTYPPDFTYISEDRLESAMWRLAAQVRRLDTVLRDDALSDADRQHAVLATLDGIDGQTRQLLDDRTTTNHPLLDTHIPQLRDDVALARSAAGAAPPRYALAGAVAGACIYCHSARVPLASPGDRGP